MRSLFLVLSLSALTQTAAAQSVGGSLASQLVAIQKLNDTVARQQREIERLNDYAPKVLISQSQGNCEYDFNGKLDLHAQVRVTVGIFNVQPSSAVFIFNRDDNGRLGFLRLGNNAPGNNDGNIEVVGGTKVIATVGGVGASCTITAQKVF